MIDCNRPSDHDWPNIGVSLPSTDERYATSVSPARAKTAVAAFVVTAKVPSGFCKSTGESPVRSRSLVPILTGTHALPAPRR